MTDYRIVFDITFDCCGETVTNESGSLHETVALVEAHKPSTCKKKRRWWHKWTMTRST